MTSGTSVQLERASTAYKREKRKKNLIIGALALTGLLLMLLSIGIGAAKLDFNQIINALLMVEDGKSNLIIWQIRLPRIIAGMMIGYCLAVSGCVMQSCLRNPIASPSTLGISNAAAFGANIAIVFLGAGTYRSAATDAVTISNPYSVTVFAFVFSLIAMGGILLLAKVKRFSPEAVVLAGVAFGSLFSAGSTLIQYFADDVQVAATVFWAFGDLGRIAWRELGILFIVMMASSGYFMYNRWNYNALDQGEATAKSLGVDVERLRFLSLLLASLITAVSVAFVGIIGFVGLIAPQMMRRVIGEDHGFLIPAAALTGGLVLLLADVLARSLISPIVLPVGAITSFLGSPLFLYLLLKGGKPS